MFLKVVRLGLEAEKPVVILNEADAQDLDVRALDRVEVKANKKVLVAIVNTARKFIKKGSIGLYGEIAERMKVKDGKRIEVKRAAAPESLKFVRKKVDGDTLKEDEIRKIVDDVVHQRLSEIEVAAFVISLHNFGISMDEAASLSTAMAVTGEVLNLDEKKIFDKHSVGGCPGDKTSMLLVPVVAAAGLTIPKTSSRSITSAAGTADKVECLCPVELDLDEIKRVVKRTKGCLVWGGAVNLAPADDIFIQVEYPLSIDPLLLPSVISKKKAVGARYLAIDIPTGKGTKIKTIGEAYELGSKFIELGKRLGIKVNCLSSFGEQPIGYTVGPALEAREALTTIRGKRPIDLIDKVCHVASILFSFAGIGNGEDKALQILRSGKAEKKLREIIAAQGGSEKIRPADIPVGDKRMKIKSTRVGTVLWINNNAVVQIARELGAPKDKGAGVKLYNKIGDRVKKGETILELFAEKTYKLNRGLEAAKSLDIIGIGDKHEMLLAKIPKELHERYFILER
jgi:AMP phosphorylase